MKTKVNKVNSKSQNNLEEYPSDLILALAEIESSDKEFNKYLDQKLPEGVTRKELMRITMLKFYEMKKEEYSLLIDFYNSKDPKLTKERLSKLRKSIKDIEPVAEEVREQISEQKRLREMGNYYLLYVDYYVNLNKKNQKELDKIKKMIDVEKPLFEKRFQTARVNEILKNYKKNPLAFNNHHQENEYYGNDAKELIEFFCNRVNEKKPLKNNLLEYFRDCFEKILRGGTSLERCLNLVGRKEENPSEYPDYLEEVFLDILEKKSSHTDAFKNCQKKGIDKSEKRLSNQLHAYSKQLCAHWLLSKFIKKNKNKKEIQPLMLNDLSSWQLEKLSESFDIDLSNYKDNLLEWRKSL